MRHGKKNNHLGRTASHRAALLSNLASSLILHKRIKTTVAKARELRKYVEPLLTRSKDDSTHSRRTVFAFLQNKESLKELFGTVADKVATRPGGYTRIIKLGTRLGDNAEMCIIELVDFNETLLAAKEEKAAKSTRRSRRSGGGTKVAASAVSEAIVVDAVSDEVVADEATEAPVAEAEVEATEAPVAEAEVEATEAPVAEAEVTEAAAEEASASDDSPAADEAAEDENKA
jgi:large subunit ribosomal protein L17